MYPKKHAYVEKKAVKAALTLVRNFCANCPNFEECSYILELL